MGDWSDFEEMMADRDGAVFGDEHLYDGEPDEAEKAAAFGAHMGVMEEGHALIGDEVRQHPDAPGAPIFIGGPPLLTEHQRYERIDGEWMRWHLPGSRWVRVPTEDLAFIEAIETTRRELAKSRADAARMDWLEVRKVFHASYWPCEAPPHWTIDCVAREFSGRTFRDAVDAGMLAGEEDE